MPSDEGRVLDILLAADDIADFIQGKSYADYEASPLLQSAVERKVYIIGEAVRSLSGPFKAHH